MTTIVFVCISLSSLINNYCVLLHLHFFVILCDHCHAKTKEVKSCRSSYVATITEDVKLHYNPLIAGAIVPLDYWTVYSYSWYY